MMPMLFDNLLMLFTLNFLQKIVKNFLIMFCFSVEHTHSSELPAIPHTPIQTTFGRIAVLNDSTELTGKGH